MRELLQTGAGRAYAAAAAAIALVTVIGLAVLWPGEVEPKLGQVFPEPTPSGRR